MIFGVGTFFYSSTHLLPSNEPKAPALSLSIDDVTKPYLDLFHSVILLLFTYASFSTALIHCEIRSLLIFKKLRELQMDKQS